MAVYRTVGKRNKWSKERKLFHKMDQGHVEYINENKIGNVYHMFMCQYVQQAFKSFWPKRD